MNDRSTRFSIAILLTAMDLAVFDHFFGVIWAASSGVAWFRLTLMLMLVVWTASAAVLWLHVAYDVRLFLYERRVGAAVLKQSAVPEELRRGSDV